MRLCAVLLGLAVAACGDDDGAAPPTADAGTDAEVGDVADSGPGDGADDSPLPDGGPDAPPPPPFELSAPTTWQRGLVSLYLVLSDERGSWPVHFQFSEDGTSYADMTIRRDFGAGDGPFEPGPRRVVWDAPADVARDVDAVWVRAGALGGEQTAGPFPLLGDPDRPRALLITSAINQNDKVRRLGWGEVAPDTLSFDESDLFVTTGPPEHVVFDPGGRTALTLEPWEGNITVFSFDAGGQVTSQRDLAIDFYAVEGAYLDDASRLFLLNEDPSAEGGLYLVECDPWTGEPVSGEAPQQMSSHYVATAFEVLPGGGFAVLGTSQDDPAGDLVLAGLTAYGEPAAEVFFGAPGSLAQSLAVSSDGRWLLASYTNLFDADEEGVALIERSEGGELELVDATYVRDPADVAFHSSSQAALVAGASSNRVVPLRIQVADGAGSLVVGTGLRVDLADQIARVRWGSDVDLFFVTTVGLSTGESGLSVVRLDAGGNASLESSFSLGRGADVIPRDVAIQP